MVLIGIILSVVLIVVGAAVIEKHENAGRFSFWIGIIMLIVILIVWPVSYGSSIGENGWLLATQKNIKVSQQVATQINSIATVKDVVPGSMVGGVENLKQSSNASDAVRDCGNLIQDYNNVIGRREVQRNNWFLRAFVAPLPPGIQMVESVNFQH